MGGQGIEARVRVDPARPRRRERHRALELETGRVGEEMADGRPGRAGLVVERDQTPVRGDQHGQRRDELGHRRPAEDVIGVAARGEDAVRPDDRRGGMLGAPRVDRRRARRRSRSWRKRIGPGGPGRLPRSRLARPVDGAACRTVPCWTHAGTSPPAGPRHGPRRPPRPRRQLRRDRDRVPGRQGGLPQLHRGHRRGRRRRRRAPVDRLPLLDRQVATRDATSGRSRSPTTSPIDEAEPEVMFDGTHHADEHMATEMTLHILHWLVDGYGVDPRITSIVNSREIWIVFVVNPDGAEYDISGGRFHSLAQEPPADARDDRRSAPTSTATTATAGAAAGATSSNPQAITYRGPRAFSTPEDRAMRDFMASRVVDGRQQIRAAITFHEFGRLVMWPYGYTHRERPVRHDDAGPRGARQDRPAHGRDQRLHARSRRATCTSAPARRATTSTASTGSSRSPFEMSVVDYPDDSKIASETGRNKEAVLYLMERAWCPLGVLGATVRTARCGAFDDDLEVYRGWTRQPGRDRHRAGRGRLRPRQPGLDDEPRPEAARDDPLRRAGLRHRCARAGATASANDLDGRTTVRSPRIVLPATLGQRLTFAYVFAHSAASGPSDTLRAIVEKADGTQVEVWREPGARPTSTASGGRRRSRSMPSPARRSASGSRPSTAVPTTWSRSSSTTSG